MTFKRARGNDDDDTTLSRQRSKGNHGSPMQMMDLMMGQFIATQMTSTLGSSEFGIHSVFKVLLLSSLNEVTDLARSVITEGYELLRSKYSPWVRRLNWQLRSLTTRGNYGQHKIIENDTNANYTNTCDNAGSVLELDTVLPLSVLSGLCEYLLQQASKCSYTIENDNRNIVVLSLKETQVEESWTDVSICYKTINIELVDGMRLLWKKRDDRQYLQRYIGTATLSTTNARTVTRFTDLFPTTLNVIKTSIRLWADELVNEPSHNGMSTTSTSDKFDENDPGEMNFIKLLKQCWYPSLHIMVSFHEIVLFLHLVTKQLRIYKYRSWLSDMITTCIEDATFTLLQHRLVLPSKMSDELSILESTCSSDDQYRDLSMRKYHIDISPTLMESTITELRSYLSQQNDQHHLSSTSSNVASDNNALRFLITTSDRSLNKGQLFCVFEQFIRDIQNFNPKLTSGAADETRVYRIVLTRPVAENRTQRQNNIPSKRKKSARSSDDNTDKSGDDVMDHQNRTVAKKKKALISTMPRSKLDVTIQAELIGTTDKTFETLYLRSDDMQRLRAVLHLFHHKKEHLKKLGLPYRLACLFGGFPGTGKSSAIACVSNYLGRDIYYVSLKEIRTDDELLRVVSYVNQQGNGCIVFEEIERNVPQLVCTEEYLATVPHMTSTTASRSSTNTGALVDSDPPRLTLECLLNVLQGTLTQSGTVFCATTNHIERLQPALFRSGRFDLTIDMKKCDRYMVSQIYRSFMGRPLPDHLLAKIPEDVYSCSDIMFTLSPLLFTNLSDEEIVDKILSTKPSDRIAR